MGGCGLPGPIGPPGEGPFGLTRGQVLDMTIDGINTSLNCGEISKDSFLRLMRQVEKYRQTYEFRLDEELERDEVYEKIWYGG